MHNIVSTYKVDQKRTSLHHVTRRSAKIALQLYFSACARPRLPMLRGVSTGILQKEQFKNTVDIMRVISLCLKPQSSTTQSLPMDFPMLAPFGLLRLGAFFVSRRDAPRHASRKCSAPLQPSLVAV